MKPAAAPICALFDAPQNDYKSPLDCFEYSLKHENFVTDSINKLMDLARKDNNHAAQIFLQWFVTEQVEEEASFGLIVKKLQRIGDDGNGLLRLDEELAQRVFVPPQREPDQSQRSQHESKIRRTF